MSVATYLTDYESWVRGGRQGLAPSPIPHGILASDVTSDVCAVDAKVRAESGLGTWQYYDPRRKG